MLDDPGPRAREGSSRGEDGAGQEAVVKGEEAAWAGRRVGIGDDIIVIAERKRPSRESGPIGRRSKAREFGARTSLNDRFGEIVCLVSGDGPDRSRKGVPRRV